MAHKFTVCKILLPKHYKTREQPPPLSVWPHLFSGPGHEKKRGEQLKLSLKKKKNLFITNKHINRTSD